MQSSIAVRIDLFEGTYLVQSNKLPHTCEEVGNKVPIQLSLDCGKNAKRARDVPKNRRAKTLK